MFISQFFFRCQKFTYVFTFAFGLLHTSAVQLCCHREYRSTHTQTYASVHTIFGAEHSLKFAQFCCGQRAAYKNDLCLHKLSKFALQIDLLHTHTHTWPHTHSPVCLIVIRCGILLPPPANPIAKQSWDLHIWRLSNANKS